MSRRAERRLLRQIDRAIQDQRSGKIRLVAAGCNTSATYSAERIAALELERAACRARLYTTPPSAASSTRPRKASRAGN